MNSELLLGGVIFVGFLLLYLLIQKRLSKLENSSENDTLVAWLKTMQTSLETTNKTLNEALHANSNHMVKTLQENSKQLNERLDQAASVIRDVGKEVGQMSEIGRSMKELQEFLKSPKLRGNIGEQVLKDLIAQMFPKHSFHLQYQFKSGERVDAAIQTDAGILPIDSKFPMENFQKMMKETNEQEKERTKKEFFRDIKHHVDAIAKKYVLPDEGTMDFALMYVPSESVYYEIICEQSMLEYARKNRVYVVSPTTLYAHLQTILLSFEGKKIEVRSKEIMKHLQTIQIEYEKIDENLEVLGKHLGNASNQFHNVTLGFAHMGQKLQATKNLEEHTLPQLQS